MAEVSTIARPYAKAAFSYAVDNGQLADWSQVLAQLSALAEHDEMAAVLDSASLTDEQKADILIDVGGVSDKTQVKNFIRVLADHKRLKAIPAISEAYQTLKANQEQTVDVEVFSAFALSEQQSDALERALQNKLQRQVSVSSEVDNSLIGGVVIRAGDMVIDDSIRGRLEKLALEMGS